MAKSFFGFNKDTGKLELAVNKSISPSDLKEQLKKARDVAEQQSGAKVKRVKIWPL